MHLTICICASVMPLLIGVGGRFFAEKSTAVKIVTTVLLCLLLLAGVVQWKTAWSARGYAATAVVYAAAWYALLQLAWLSTLLLPRSKRASLSWWLFIPAVCFILIWGMIAAIFVPSPPQSAGKLAPSLGYSVDGFGMALTTEGADVKIFSYPRWFPLIQRRASTFTFLEGACDTRFIDVTYIDVSKQVRLTCLGEYNLSTRSRKPSLISSVEVPS